MAEVFFSSLWARVNGLDKQGGQTVKPDEVSKAQEISGLISFSLLFCSWGLAYGLLDVMNYHIKVIMGIERSQAALLALAYYLAYWVGSPMISGPIVKKFGYRAAALVGLVVLAVGDQLMSVGAQSLSLQGMCGAHFVVGVGVSVLERCANAYTLNVGPRTRATLRILVAQSAAAFGTIIAPPLANKAIFDAAKSAVMPLADPTDPSRCLMSSAAAAGEAGGLSSVVSFYRYLGAGIAGLVVALGFLFFGTKLVVEPEVPASPRLDHSRFKFWKHPLFSFKKNSRLHLGWCANFLNLGCQVTVAQFFIEHLRVDGCLSDGQATNGMMYAQILFLFGRLAAVGLILVPQMPWLRKARWVRATFQPRVVLAAFVLLAAAFTGAGVVAVGKAAFACACLVMFFEAPSFPMIFESSTALSDEWASSAESFMIVSISGGGILPIVMGSLADKVGIAKAWSVPTICFALVFSYALLLNIVPSYRQAIDEAHKEHPDAKGEAPAGEVELADRSGGPEP